MSDFSKLRVGTGFDVHPFVEGKPLWVGGVLIPHSKGLLGHSDADVLIHAIVDAILGAIGEGDIGLHFPPTDERWAGASSSKFLEYVQELVWKRGGEIINIDSVIMAEVPKFRPHIDQIREKLATLLGLSIGQVSVKATTTEKLGFVGREEGIAAQAVCLLTVK